MRDDSAEDHARVAEEARQAAKASAATAQATAKAMAEQARPDALTGMREEAIRQRGLISGGMIGVAVLMVQPFLTASSLDASATVCVLAFSVAIPLLAALVLINWQEAFRRRRTASVTVNTAQLIALVSSFVGIAASFWHMSWIVGIVFLAAGLIAVGVYSIGYMRLAATQEPAS